jgi:penicillin-binding protein 1A
MIVDAPVTFSTAVGPYTPHNYDDTFEGTVSLVHAFADSRNIPAVKLAERVGIRKVIATAHQFGLNSTIPPFLPVALGSVEATLEEQVAAYSSFPNDGVRLGPHLIRKVTNADGLTLSENPANVVESTTQRTARTMMTLFKAVVGPGGTAADAMTLHHPLGGKTGTTSDFNDAWFIGFSPSITCGVWIGYDNRQSLGDKESGGHAALPLWINFMKVAIADRPDEHFPGDVRKPPPINVATKTAVTHPTGRPPATPQ